MSISNSSVDEQDLDELMPFNLGGGQWTTLEKTCLISYVSVMVAFIILSNSFVIYAVHNVPALNTVANHFLVSLSFTDLLMGCAVMPFAAHYNISGRWEWGLTMCKVNEQWRLLTEIRIRIRLKYFIAKARSCNYFFLETMDSFS